MLEVVGTLYDAALRPDDWQEALTGLAALFDARAAGIRIEDADGLRQTWVGLEPSFDRAYQDYYWRHDPWAAPVHHAPVGVVGCGEAIVSRAILERSAFYNELARPFDLDDLGGALLERRGGRAISFGVMKAGGQRFTADDEALLTQVAPHVRRALTLSERLHGRGGDAAAPTTERLEALLRRAYRLTAAEAQVAVRVARGVSPKALAAERKTSWFTVRAQLRQIFDKMECRSQSELAHRITKLELHLAREDASRPR